MFLETNVLRCCKCFLTPFESQVISWCKQTKRKWFYGISLFFLNSFPNPRSKNNVYFTVDTYDTNNSSEFLKGS